MGKRLGRGVRISSQSKMIVEKVRQHFEKEREQGGPIKMSCVVERTAITTGLAVRTVFNIHKEATLVNVFERFSIHKISYRMGETE